MASLNFKGKTAVWNHHLSVPYHTLEKNDKNSLKGDGEHENMIIEGDNLLALKALLPKYQGKVKCIYIDPPYNTGNEGWVYNDNVSSPVIQDWLGQTVGKEGEDLTRHDKWLCMMVPRLKLLRELLTEDGVIFVSIDDNEVHHLRQIMDEVFGEEKLVATLVWNTKQASKGVPPIKMVTSIHEHILVYEKGCDFKFKGIKRTTEDFSNPDNDPRGLWRKEAVVSTISKKLFEIKDPATGNIFRRAWAFSPDSIEKMIAEERIIFPNSPTGTPLQKKFFYDYTNENVPINTQIGTFQSRKATSDLLRMFDDKKMFDFPKPTELIRFLIQQSTDKDDIILDSFAGSGTTAQAVLELNKEDGGNRKYILVQLPEAIAEGKPAYEAGYRFVHEITRDRVKKVIARDKLKVGFTYYTLGPSINAHDILKGKNLPAWEVFAKYVHYLATGKPLEEVKKPNATGEIVSGKKHTHVYLLYADNMETLKTLAVTRDWLEAVKNTEGKKVVYAPACFLEKEVLDTYGISFVQIPFALFQRK